MGETTNAINVNNLSFENQNGDQFGTSSNFTRLNKSQFLANLPTLSTLFEFPKSEPVTNQRADLLSVLSYI